MATKDMDFINMFGSCINKGLALVRDSVDGDLLRQVSTYSEGSAKSSEYGRYTHQPYSFGVDDFSCQTSSCYTSENTSVTHVRHYVHQPYSFTGPTEIDVPTYGVHEFPPTQCPQQQLAYSPINNIKFSSSSEFKSITYDTSALSILDDSLRSQVVVSSPPDSVEQRANVHRRRSVSSPICHRKWTETHYCNNSCLPLVLRSGNEAAVVETTANLSEITVNVCLLEEGGQKSIDTNEEYSPKSAKESTLGHSSRQASTVLSVDESNNDNNKPCPHEECWKRLRERRGIAHYMCQQCLAKWKFYSARRKQKN